MSLSAAAVGIYIHLAQAREAEEAKCSPGSDKGLVLGLPQDVIVRQQKPGLYAFVFNLLLFMGRLKPRHPGETGFRACVLCLEHAPRGSIHDLPYIAELGRHGRGNGPHCRAQSCASRRGFGVAGPGIIPPLVDHGSKGVDSLKVE